MNYKPAVENVYFKSHSHPKAHYVVKIIQCVLEEQEGPKVHFIPGSDLSLFLLQWKVMCDLSVDGRDTKYDTCLCLKLLHNDTAHIFGDTSMKG